MNKNISKTHVGILDSKRQKLLEHLLPFTKGFVLGGGTALSLQIAHRLSFDFDFFSPSTISPTLLEKLTKSIQIGNIAVDTSSELTFFTKDDIKVTFLSYPFTPHFGYTALENGLALFKIKEIALQKAYTIGRRGEYRDYYDLYVLLKDGYIDIHQLLSAAKTVYGSAFDEKMFFQQLVYFNDLSNFAIVPTPNAPIPLPETVKGYFEELVSQIV